MSSRLRFTLPVLFSLSLFLQAFALEASECALKDSTGTSKKISAFQPEVFAWMGKYGEEMGAISLTTEDEPESHLRITEIRSRCDHHLRIRGYESGLFRHSLAEILVAGHKQGVSFAVEQFVVLNKGKKSTVEHHLVAQDLKAHHTLREGLHNYRSDFRVPLEQDGSFISIDYVDDPYIEITTVANEGEKAEVLKMPTAEFLRILKSQLDLDGLARDREIIRENPNLAAEKIAAISRVRALKVNEMKYQLIVKSLKTNLLDMPRLIDGMADTFRNRLNKEGKESFTSSRFAKIRAQVGNLLLQVQVVSAFQVWDAQRTQR